MTGTETMQRPTSAPVAQSRAGIPTTRLIGVELQKMFDTRSGFWLVTGSGIAALVATVATILFAPHSSLGYSAFASAIGVPLTIILPMVGILGVTSEWSQRTGLSTFTMVPRRGRVIGAKAVAVIAIGLGSIVVAFAIGALGNVIGSSLVGVPIRWDISVAEVARIFLADGLGMMMGFTLGVLIRNSPGAIVAYFVWGLVLPAVLGALASVQHWFAQAQGWIDFRFSTTQLYGDHLTATDWAHLGVSGLIWLVIPLVIGLRLLMRSEVK